MEVEGRGQSMKMMLRAITPTHLGLEGMNLITYNIIDLLDVLRRLQKSFQKNQEVKKTSLEKSKKSQKC